MHIITTQSMGSVFGQGLQALRVSPTCRPLDTLVTAYCISLVMLIQQIKVMLI